MRVPPTTLASACLLCTLSAVGEGADTAFCDTIDGTIAEFRDGDDLIDYRAANDSLGSDYRVYRVPRPTKLPGAADCTAYVYDDTVFYTCRWTSDSPRSTFVDFGTRLDHCLSERGYSRPWEGKRRLEGPLIAGVRTAEGEGHFAQFWRGGRKDRYGVILKAYKMSTKGVFLQMRFYDPAFLGLVRQVEDWSSAHASAIITEDRNYYSRDNPFATARPGAQKEEEASELWKNAGENPGELSERIVGHWKVEG